MNRLVAGLSAVALVGAIVWSLGLMSEPERALQSALFSAISVWALLSGVQFVISLATLSRARWILVMRPAFEAVMGAMPASTLLLAGAIAMWRGGTHEALPPFHDAPWFFARSALYLALPLGASEIFLRASRGSNHDDASREQHLRVASALGVLSALGPCLGAIDWTSAAAPGWSNNALGFELVASGVLSGTALASLVVIVPSHPWIREDHLHALGKVLFTAAAAWTYLVFGPFLITWIGDVPRASQAWLPRIRGAWAPLAWALVVTRVLLPTSLLPSAPKRSRRWLIVLSLMLVASLPIEMAWWFLPAIEADSFRLQSSDFAALATSAAVPALMALLRNRHTPALSEGDPRLPSSLAHR